MCGGVVMAILRTLAAHLLFALLTLLNRCIYALFEIKHICSEIAMEPVG